MLCLTREVNQRIVIADNIVVTVVSINRDRVRLGIDAPKDTPVHREEVALRIAADRRPDPAA